MANAYTPGLKVTDHMVCRIRRVLPISGDVLVKVGAHVKARDIVAQTFMPGDVTPVNLANQLSLPPADIPACMLKKEGERIEVGDTIARTKGVFGMFKNELKAKVAGTIETISEVTGQMMVRGEPLPVQVAAYVDGTITQILPREGVILESHAAFIQGIFGIGGEACGRIVMAGTSYEEDLTAGLIRPEMKGAIIIGGARMHNDAVRRAIEYGAAAIVSGGIDDSDLKEILGYDLGVAITGTEHIGITLIITEGFGDIAMARRTFDLLAGRKGCVASVNGATQIRAGVMRPEVIIPINEGLGDRQETVGIQEAAGSRNVAGLLEVGTPIRIIRDPYFGLIGNVKALPPEPAALGSGSKARVLEVALERGEAVTVPRANVELIES